MELKNEILRKHLKGLKTLEASEGFIYNAMDEYAAQMQIPQWISVKDKLPEADEQHNKTFSSGKVLVYGDEGCELDEYLKHYEDSPSGLKKISEGWMVGDKITHWMELPKRPVSINPIVIDSEEENRKRKDNTDYGMCD